MKDLVPPSTLVSPKYSWEDTIYYYGILTILYAVEILERDEFYEECSLIMKGLDELSVKVRHELPRRIGTEALDLVRNTWEEQNRPDVSDDYIKEKYQRFAYTLLTELGYK